MTRKKIDFLTIVIGDNGGGAQQTQYNVVHELIKQGKKCHVTIIKPKQDGRWESLESKCTVTYFPFKSVFLGYIYLVPFLIGLSIRYKIKYTFTSQTLINGMVGFFKRLGILKSTKVIVRESNTIFELLNGTKLTRYQRAYKIGYPGVDLVICQTNYMKDKLIEALPWLEDKTKVVVISNPINYDDILEKSKVAIPELQTEGYIVAAGRLVDAKGFDLLIDAYSNIKTQIANCKLFILGDGERRENLTSQINRLGLEGSVVLKGMVPNVYPYFKNAQLCVMSSRIEGFPNVLLQMMSQNNKIVSTLSAGDIDQIPNIYTCATEDEKGLSEAILKCFNEDTSKNRVIFDDYLNKRKLSTFVNEMIALVDNG